LMSAQSIGAEELIIWAAIDGICASAMVEADQIFFFNIVFGAGFNPGHSLFLQLLTDVLSGEMTVLILRQEARPPYAGNHRCPELASPDPNLRGTQVDRVWQSAVARA